jgi:AP-1-like factor
LETKVEDLQKASESANHENAILRAQIEKMSMELREHRKKVSLSGPNKSPSSNNGLPPYLAGKGLGGGANNPSDVNFSFEFPRFGRLPGPPVTNGSQNFLNSNRQTSSPTATSQLDSASPIQVSPRNQSLQSFSSNGSTTALKQTSTQVDGDMSSLSGLFSPSILNSVGKDSSFEFFNANGTNGSRSSTDSNGHMSTGHNTSYSSPSASSNGNQGPSSSCGTSPEPTMQSPVFNKPVDVTLSTIGEENTTEPRPEGELTFCEKLNMACGNPNNPVPQTMSESTSGNPETPAFDINGIDWFAQQNGNQFDPQLFGDYREPQDNILSGEAAFSDTFFQDAYALPDFNSPFNMAPSPAPPKKDLVAQIDDKQNEDEEVVPGEDKSSLLTCNTIWYVYSTRSPMLFHNANIIIRDRLQACPKVKDGEFDLDLLCKDLQKKAKCSETGAVVNESDFNKIMKSYADKKPTNKA